MANERDLMAMAVGAIVYLKPCLQEFKAFFFTFVLNFKKSFNTFFFVKEPLSWGERTIALNAPNKYNHFVSP